MFYCPFALNNLYRLNNEISYARILHASPNTPAIDVYINDKRVASNLKYKQFTEFFPITPSKYNIKVYFSGTKMMPVLNKNITIPDNEILTSAVIGLSPNIDLFTVPEPVETLQDNKFGIRLVHLSPNAPAVNLYLDDTIEIANNISYKEFSNYIQASPSTYTLKLKLSNDGKTILIAPNITLKPNRFYSVYVVGSAEGTPPLQFLIPLDGNSYLR